MSHVIRVAFGGDPARLASTSKPIALTITPGLSLARSASRKPVGQTVTLSGTAGVLVRVHSATGANTFDGAKDLIHPEYQVLKEARQTEDFEGYVSWGLGLSKPTCIRAFTLSDPARLVVDLKITTS